MHKLAPRIGLAERASIDVREPTLLELLGGPRQSLRRCINPTPQVR